MTKKKSDSLRTSKNKRVSPYGEYYISVKKIDMLERGRLREFVHSGNSFWIKVIFETSPEHFDKVCGGRYVQTEYPLTWEYNIPLSVTYNLGQSLYYFDASIYSPSLTTLNIIKGEHFIRLLLGDKEIYGALTHFMEFFSMSNLPGNRPISALESFLKRQILDIEMRLKLQICYPIAFEDIEEVWNMEVREEALRKFGYEDYVKEGFKKGKIDKVTVDKDVVVLDNTTYCYIGARDKVPPLTKKFDPRYNHDEKLIFMENDIAFLQVKDTSTNKAYFLKVPPSMNSVEEAKAWTFGLNPGEYSPAVET